MVVVLFVIGLNPHLIPATFTIDFYKNKFTLVMRGASPFNKTHERQCNKGKTLKAS